MNITSVLSRHIVQRYSKDSLHFFGEEDETEMIGSCCLLASWEFP